MYVFASVCKYLNSGMGCSPICLMFIYAIAVYLFSKITFISYR